MIQEKLKELELQLNYVCYDKELITRLSKVWDAYYDLKGEVKKLNIAAVIKSVCDDCTAYPFDERGKTPLCKTCKDNPSQTVL